MIEHNKIHAHVIDIIKRYASEDKPIDQNEILEKLQEEPDTQCERKTVTRALEKLRADYGPDENGVWPDEDMKLHFITVERSSSPIYKQYWFEINSDGLSDEELMFLMLAVQFSKHVDQAYADDIVRKLRNLSDNKYSSKFELFAVLNEKNHPVMKEFFLVLDDINRAIDKDKMISFYLNEYGTDKKLHRAGAPIEVSPYRVVGSDGDLYLLCTQRDSLVIRSYRIDRISGVTMLDENSQHPAQKSTAVFRTNKYLSEHRYLYSGDVVEVTMMIDRSILGDVIDSFGNKIEIEPADESVNRLTIHLKSCERDVIEWAMRYGEHALIVEPEYLRNEIRERAKLLTSFYRDDERPDDYDDRIERARRHRRLMLNNVDLNGRDSYRELTDIWALHLRHNGINDFSFLALYEHLFELIIEYNNISDPGVIGRLSRLRTLGLIRTGVTNLDFLRGLDRLAYLSIREYSLENVDAIYSLPGLKELTVNKTTSRLLDKNRLKRIYGQGFRYVVEDYEGLPRVFRPSLPSDSDRYINVRRDTEVMDSFTTSPLSDLSIRRALCSKIQSERRSLREGKMFRLVPEACDGNDRLFHCDDLTHYASDDYIWYVTYDGTNDGDLTVDDINSVYAISIFKHDHGLKLIGMAERDFERRIENDREAGRDIREKAHQAIMANVRHILNNNIGWAEVNGHLENVFCRVGTMNDVINPVLLMNYRVFEDIEIGGDDYHYIRRNFNNQKKCTLIAYGHIELR